MNLRASLSKLISGAIAVAALAALPGHASASLITNGSFETGDFSGWTQFGSTTFNGVYCPGVSGLGVTDANCAGFFGAVRSTGGIEQTFATAFGANLLVSFDYLGFGGTPVTPSSFLAEFISGGTTTLVDLTNHSGAVNFSQTFVAGAATSTLRFSFRQDAAFDFLDNVQVVPEPASVPEPIGAAVVGLALACLTASRRRKAA